MITTTPDIFCRTEKNHGDKQFNQIGKSHKTIATLMCLMFNAAHCRVSA